MAERSQWLDDLMEFESWTRQEFVSWLCGRDPDTVPTSPDEWDADLQRAEKQAERTGGLEREYTGAKISDDREPDYHVRRDDAIRWAVNNKALFPNCPTSGEDLPAAPDVLDTRERTTLLIIIAALARHAKLDITEPTKAAAVIEADMLALGWKLDARTIAAHLKRIPDALERKR
jgi:hypothetical protein